MNTGERRLRENPPLPPTASHDKEPIVVEGHIDRVKYHSTETQFTVARFREKSTGGVFTVLARLADPGSGEPLRLRGFWEEHPRWGPQFRVMSADPLQPTRLDALQRYLASGFIPGVGPKTAAKLVRHFGDNTVAVIEKEPQRLTEVAGIGSGTAERIAARWNSRHALRRLVEFLRSHGVRDVHAVELYRHYGDQAEAILRDDPFRVAVDLPRIGFAIADRILISRRGVSPDDPVRVRACLLNLLRELAENGDACVPLPELVDLGRRRFDIGADSTAAAVAHLQAEGELTVETTARGASANVYLQALYAAESAVAARLEALLSLPPPTEPSSRPDPPATALTETGLELSAEQQAVLQNVLHCRAAVITGGPGTGKTTLIRAVADVLESQGHAVALAAPTGRAARRISEVCRRPAFTLHKLLGYLPSEERFEHDCSNPLPADVVIVDEASMLDILLTAHLLEALSATSRMILVGDVYQLPPVGPGAVLSDLIQSGRLEHYRLNRIFRQARESRITVNAHRIRRGENPICDPIDPYGGQTDFYLLEFHRSDAIVQTTLDLCCRQIPQYFGFDPVRDIQILTPTHKGRLGTHSLNQILQQRLNPRTDTPEGSGLRIGDKVMQLKNNYRKNIYNGDTGVIAEIDSRNAIVSVDFDGRLIDYPPEERDELSLAYAMTVHKAQGSEYPAVLLLMANQHYPLLQRNLLYTAVTRGRRLVVIVGTGRALQLALANDAPHRRRTGLLDRLRQTGGENQESVF